eukprot:m.110102 g.110102  ORF g.110102 m.110102 type:complete len:100 (+) comp12741_c4_seq11:49-348(+)
MLLAQKHLCQRTALFGKGTYFSDDLSVCLSFSPQSAKAPFSRLGENVSCICVCEVAQHPHIKVCRGDYACMCVCVFITKAFFVCCVLIVFKQLNYSRRL